MKDGSLRLWMFLCLGESAKVLNFVNLAPRFGFELNASVLILRLAQMNVS